MSEELPKETKSEFGARLARLVEESLGGDAFPNPEGWRFDGVTLREVVTASADIAQAINLGRPVPLITIWRASPPPADIRQSVSVPA